MHCRLAIMGGEGVGKSCIVARFMFDRFKELHDKTIEDLFRRKFILNGTALSLDILDTAGSDEYPDKTEFALTSCEAFIFVFALDSSSSIEKVKSLLDRVVKVKGHEKLPVVVVAHKTDVDDRRVTSGMDIFANRSMQFGYVEASAKENVNIDEIFKELLRQKGLSDERIDEFFRAK